MVYNLYIMRIILSPAKTFCLENPINEDWVIHAPTRKIVDSIKQKTPEEIRQILKVSDKLLEQIMRYIDGFDEMRSYSAISMYSGAAYKALDVNSMSVQQQEYLEQNVLILSAMYGVLKPSENIKPYRLDFHSKLKVDGCSLKKFWKGYYNFCIKEGETVLNLASNEFSNLFVKSRYDWYDFDFFELLDGEKKKNSTIAKKGRGRLLRDMAVAGITDVYEIKTLSGFGRYFDCDRLK